MAVSQRLFSVHCYRLPMIGSIQPGSARRFCVSEPAAMLILIGFLLVIVITAATGYFVAQEFGYVAVDRGKLRAARRRRRPGRRRAP